MTRFVNLLDPEYIGGFRERQKKPVQAVPTCFPSWNSVSGGDGGGRGLARGWFVVIGGNPKFGKTLLSLNLVATAVKASEPVGFMSLEMSDPELAARFYAMLGRSRSDHLERGRFKDEALDAAVDVMRDLPWDNGLPKLLVNSDPMFDLYTVLDHMRSLHEVEGVRFFVLDYLQLVSMGDDDEAVKTVTVAAKEFRKFAKSNGCTIVALSQFKRSVSEDYTRSPMPQGLFGGGAIEQTADQIALIDHSLYEYDKPNNVARTWLKLTQRHGSQGDIPIIWNYKDLSVREGLVDEEKDWPMRKRGK